METSVKGLFIEDLFLNLNCFGAPGPRDTRTSDQDICVLRLPTSGGYPRFTFRSILSHQLPKNSPTPPHASRTCATEQPPPTSQCPSRTGGDSARCSRIPRCSGQGEVTRYQDTAIQDTSARPSREGAKIESPTTLIGPVFGLVPRQGSERSNASLGPSENFSGSTGGRPSFGRCRCWH